MPIKNVLVVDDSPTDRAVLSDILTKNHYAVLIAESGEEAITRSKQLLPDLILMDIVMPGINGFQATRTIARDQARGISPSSSAPPRVKKPIRPGDCAREREIT